MEDIISHLKGLQQHAVQSKHTVQHSRLDVILTSLEEVLAFSQEKPRSEVFTFSPQLHNHTHDLVMKTE